MNFGDRMNEILKKQQQQSDYSPEELYQKLLNQYFEESLKIIEYRVINCGEREGNLGFSDYLRYEGYRDIETPFIIANRVQKQISFKPLMIMKNTVKKIPFSRSGTVYCIAEMTDVGKRVHNDLEKLFRSAGITIRMICRTYTTSYEVTLFDEGPIDENGIYRYSYKTNDLSELPNSPKWSIHYSLDER